MWRKKPTNEQTWGVPPFASERRGNWIWKVAAGKQIFPARTLSPLVVGYLCRSLGEESNKKCFAPNFWRLQSKQALTKRWGPLRTRSVEEESESAIYGRIACTGWVICRLVKLWRSKIVFAGRAFPPGLFATTEKSENLYYDKCCWRAPEVGKTVQT